MDLITHVEKPSIIRRAPAIRTSRKSTHGPLDEDRAIARAILANRGIDQVLPVMFGGKLLAWTKGKTWSDDVMWRPARPGEKWWCGFTSYDDLINEVTSNGKKLSQMWSKSHTTAGVANNFYDLWPVGGNPAAGGYGGAAHTAVVKNDTTAGSIFHGGNVSTDTKHMLSAFAFASANAPTFFLYDRCLTYEACAFNASANQTMTNTATLNRYQNAGEGGCKIMMCVQTALGATAANITQLRYTDQNGNATQSMPTSPTVAHIVSAAAPTSTLGARVIAPATAGATLPWGPHIPLAVGDGGVRLINDFTTSASNTGTFTFILQRILATIPCPTAGVASLVNLVQEIPGMERIRDGACIALMAYQPATTANTANGGFDVAWG